MAQHFRVLLYDGDPQWITEQLDRSIHGTRDCVGGSITAADVSPVDARAIVFFRNLIHTIEATVADPDPRDNEKGFG